MKIKHFERILLITMLGCAVYINTLVNGFVFDDFNFIVYNDFIKNWKNIFVLLNPSYFFKVIPDIYGAARPVWLASLILDYSIWGLNPFGYHLTSLLFHLLNSVLVYFLIYKITKNIPLGFLSGLLFTVHPMHTEAVNVISFRPDLMAAFFCLLGFIFYIDSVNSQKRRDKIIYFLSANIFYVFAVLSKDMAITLPLLFVLYDYYFLAEGNFGKFYKRFKWHAGYLVLTTMFLLFRLPRFNYNVPTIVNTSIYSNITDNIFTMSTVFANYIKLLIVPVKLCADYTCYPIFRSMVQPEVFISIIVIIFSIFLGFFSFKKNKLVSFCIFWFFIALIPVSNIIPLLNISAERYLYFPSIGFCVLLAVLINSPLSSLSKREEAKIGILLLFLILVFYSAITVTRNPVWADSYTLWSQTSAAYPNNVKARVNYAAALYDNGDIDGAKKQYQEALKKYDELKSIVVCNMNMSVIHNDLGVLYLQQEKFRKARESFEKGLKIAPKNPVLLKNLAYTNCLKNK
ncbi:MAG: hypothetical protein A3J83_03910 [Elusimicrobia bacterium RIFOXYA2_FULL_40_6]|nr:MAG: hypothetical protein A3J83_03910 [Elusimicrobia bacterium RIFOXYA2_FULL_40_6]